MFTAREESGYVEVRCSGRTGGVLRAGAPRASSSAAEEYDCAQDEQEYRPQYPEADVQDVERSEEEYHAGDYESCAHDPGTGVHQEVRNADDHENRRPRFVEWECDQVVNKEQASDDK